jgi:hypothetical protein
VPERSVAANACVVHKEMEATEVVQRFSDEGLDVVRPANIASPMKGPDPMVSNLRRGLVGFVPRVGTRIQIVEGHVSSALGEGQGYGPADPAGTSGDDGDPAVQPTLDPIGRRLGLRANSVQELLHGRTMTFQ